VTSARVDPGALINDPGRRASLARVFESALTAVDPASAVISRLRREGNCLIAGERTIDLHDINRAIVLAFGKAAVPMAKAIVSAVGDLPTEGVVVSNVPEAVAGLTVMRAAHPVPDEASVLAARKLLEVATSAGPRDVVLVAVSGGGSALLTLPTSDVPLAAIAETTSLLLRCGASIQELNTVRKHLSAVKGGRLAEAVGGAAAIVTLVVSDVVGDDLAVIASGPMVPDPSTFTEALLILDRFDLRNAIPAPVLEHLLAGQEGRVPETVTDGHLFRNQTIELVATARTAATGALNHAIALGWEAKVVSTALTGEAVAAAARIAEEASDLSPGEMLIYAGETTVTVDADGMGGRNQELALAAAIRLAGDDGVVLMSAGTDGIDGVTKAAGAFADGRTLDRGAALGLDAAEYLRRHDSYSYLSAVGDVIHTGPTGTNVGDLILVARSG